MAIADMIDAYVENYCNILLTSTEVIEILDGGRNVYRLQKGPVTDFALTDNFNDDADVDYTLISDDGDLVIGWNLPEGTGRYLATYDAGYVTVPDGLQAIIDQMNIEANAIYSDSAGGAYKKEKNREYEYELAEDIQRIGLPHKLALESYVRY